MIGSQRPVRQQGRDRDETLEGGVLRASRFKSERYALPNARAFAGYTLFKTRGRRILVHHSKDHANDPTGRGTHYPERYQIDNYGRESNDQDHKRFELKVDRCSRDNHYHGSGDSTVLKGANAGPSFVNNSEEERPRQIRQRQRNKVWRLLH